MKKLNILLLVSYNFLLTNYHHNGKLERLINPREIFNLGKNRNCIYVTIISASYLSIPSNYQYSSKMHSQ